MKLRYEDLAPGYTPHGPRLKGRIVQDSAGIQSIKTESNEEGKAIICCLGITRINDGRIGDEVELTYMASRQNGMWFGRVVKSK